jgi:HPt (histidine-containing phosphotransfer) domain-containing protein
MARPDPAALHEAMNRLWVQFLPQIQERVSILEKAAAALAAGNLSPELCSEASSAAHKLAGVLGTFGLDQGTILAREAEALYASQAGAEAIGNDHPAALAAQLRSILSAREK